MRDLNDHDKALAILDRDGWHQGSLHDHTAGTHCAIGCYDKQLQSEGIPRLIRTATHKGYVCRENPVWNERIARAAAELVQAMGEVAADPMDWVMEWNDMEVKDPVEVRELMKKASELHEERAREAQS